MAATITIRVFTGAPAGVMSGAQTGISFLSIDSALTTPASRTANPVVAGDRSYEKWMVARVDVAPPNWVNNFFAWGDGVVMADTVLYVGNNVAYVQPTDAASGIAVNDWTNYVVGGKWTWHTAGGGDTNLVNIGDLTKHLVMQLAPAAAHGGGAWTQEVINYEYAEA